ncbi:6985_t:CDS:2 [Cetraspora pellucida]|uniref:6985_t:CDS:1 n=1 Tax=Cetraspora pellucida TaxID=1433469 RepID=A0A9N9BQ14_9GLOM|nr:6985_t:CDS:2 [Cetraspora pellucida]
MPQTETTVADIKYTVERIKYDDLPKQVYIHQLVPISTNTKATSADSIETSDVNADSTNEVDSSLVFRRIRFGGRLYGLRAGFFNFRYRV